MKLRTQKPGAALGCLERSWGLTVSLALKYGHSHSKTSLPEGLYDWKVPFFRSSWYKTKTSFHSSAFRMMIVACQRCNFSRAGSKTYAILYFCFLMGNIFYGYNVFLHSGCLLVWCHICAVFFSSETTDFSVWRLEIVECILAPLSLKLIDVCNLFSIGKLWAVCYHLWNKPLLAGGYTIKTKVLCGVCPCVSVCVWLWLEDTTPVHDCSVCVWP